MRSLIFVFALLAGCGLQQDQTTEKLDQASTTKTTIQTVISGWHANVYKHCDGTNLIYFAEGSYKAALVVVKDGCPNGR